MTAVLTEPCIAPPARAEQVAQVSLAVTGDQLCERLQTEDRGSAG